MLMTSQNLFDTFVYIQNELVKLAHAYNYACFYQEIVEKFSCFDFVLLHYLLSICKQERYHLAELYSSQTIN